MVIKMYCKQMDKYDKFEWHFICPNCKKDSKSCDWSGEAENISNTCVDGRLYHYMLICEHCGATYASIGWTTSSSLRVYDYDWDELKRVKKKVEIEEYERA